MNTNDFIYSGKIKIVSTPHRELTEESEYHSLIGATGYILRIHGNQIGVIIDGRENKKSRFGCYWFEADCIQKVV